MEDTNIETLDVNEADTTVTEMEVQVTDIQGNNSQEDNPFINLKSSFIESLEDKDLAKPLQDFKDFNALANSYIHAQKALGGKISIPKDDDTEAWDKLYSKLGAFDSPDKYSLENETFEFDKELAPQIQSLLHNGKLTDKQAKVVVNGLASLSANIEQEQVKAYEAKVNQIKESYGEEYPVIEAKIKDLAERNGLDQNTILSQVKDKPELITLLTKTYDNKKEVTPAPSHASNISPEQELDNLFKDPSIKQAWFRDAGRSLPAETRDKIKKLLQTAKL